MHVVIARRGKALTRQSKKNIYLDCFAPLAMTEKNRRYILQEYVAPELDKDGFTCPHCGFNSSQHWECLYIYNPDDFNRSNYDSTNIAYATYHVCENDSIWYNAEMIYPNIVNAPMPHKDMPDGVKTDYLEAREILNKSPRGACALLRLALDKLCDKLSDECKGENLNKKIGILVKNGLESNLQKMFDFVRLTGNDAVHELGEINAKDNPEIATALFALINTIIDEMITKPKKFGNLFDLIPKGKVEAIEKRDSTTV